MIDEKIYKSEICKYCANEECKENIILGNIQELVAGQICNITTIKCENYIYEKKEDKK